MEKIIHTIAVATWTKYNKWRVELEFHDEPKAVCWLTTAQFDYLQSAFAHTKNGYSDSRCTVVAEFSEKGYYIRCKALRQPPKAKYFTPLIDSNFNAVNSELLDSE
ncbi:MAG: hypothetical protein ACYDEG_06565 [bacterium]